MFAPWTDAMLARMRELLAQNKSAGQTAVIMADEFGTPFTRNSIIGKAHRNKVPLNKPKEFDPLRKHRKRVENLKQKKTPAPFLSKQSKAVTKLTAADVEVVAAALTEKEPSPSLVKLMKLQAPTCEPVGFLELQAHHCRYIAGDPREFETLTYCGARKQLGSSYCPHHHKKLWHKAEKKSAPHPFRAREFA